MATPSGSPFLRELVNDMGNANLVWLDLEMTGLDPDRHAICEIATIVTDSNLEVLAEGPAMVIHLDEDTLEAMDPWCVEHHGKSGLTARIKESEISNDEAEQRTLEFISTYVKPGKAPLCGNSIWQDRRFLERYMPKLEAYLHYRMIDVSSIKECVKRWYSPAYLPPPKTNTHRALDDIHESITELRYYKQKIFVDAE